MTLYRYLKKPPKVIRKKPKEMALLPYLFLGVGSLLIFVVIFPVVTFEISMAGKLKSEIITPLGTQTKVLGATTDYSLLSNWFPEASSPKEPSKITSYTISIPKLGIKDATVVNNDEDLSKHLVQWGGTGNPGEPGHTVIYGHSVLKIFADTKDYMRIFSKLEDLNKGESFFIYYDGITYRYQIVEMKVISPEDISVLEQNFDDSYVSLVTCVPPGTYLKRLVVTARLVKI